MSDLNRGDVVSLSRAQTTRVTVDAVGGAGTTHTVTLPLNPPADLRDFTYLEAAGDDADAVAAGLELALLSRPGQSVFSVAVGPALNELTIVGPLGTEFAVATTPELSSVLIENHVLATDRDGRAVGLLRVVEAESTSRKLRSFATRNRDGTVSSIEQVALRELDTSNRFEVQRTDILTIVQRAGLPRRRPGQPS